jgi:hypothetical protein
MIIDSAMSADERKEAARDAIKAVCTAEDVLTWAQTRALIHSFSFTNQVLISLQLAERGTPVREMAPIQAAWRWKHAGFHPKKGSKGIYIWAPFKAKKAADGTWQCGCGATAHGARCPVGHERRTIFVPRAVFGAADVVDHEGNRPPFPPEPQSLDGDSHDHLIKPLTDWAIATDDVKVRTVVFCEPDLDPELDKQGRSAYYRMTESGGEIVISTDQSRNSILATLIHEVTHAMGVGYEDYDRGQAEVIVESVAMLCCASIGLDTAAASAPYIAGWGGVDGEPPHSAVQRHMKVIDALCRRIEEGLFPPPATHEQSKSPSTPSDVF